MRLFGKKCFFSGVVVVLRGDNEHLNGDNLELLKLRGEVTQLRKAAAESAAAPESSREALSYQSVEVDDAIATVGPALKAYAAANNGKQPADPSQLQPYLTTPEQQAAFQTLQHKFLTNAASQ